MAIDGWWMVVVLLAAIIAVQGFAYHRLKERLRREANETFRLNQKLSDTRHELAEVNARRKKLLAAATQALIIIESDFTISSANKVAKRLFGKYSKGVSLMAWTRQHQLQELVERTLEGEKLPPIYFVWADKNLEARARVIKENKEPVAVALAIHDVTELEHLSRARRDFVANISHELRTPLASLQLLTETLLNGALDDRQMALGLVNKIAAQTDTLSQMAQEILDLSMIESGKAPLRMAPFSLRSIVQTQIDQLSPQAQRKKLTLQTDIPDDIEVLVDKTMIGRVVINLIHNAIKFTDQGGVTVSTSNNGNNTSSSEADGDGWVTVSVSDTGMGIAPEELPRIFERFYKIDRARERKGTSTGLGLAIAKHIVEGHGGQIWAESSGAGTTFYFTLPSEELVPK